MNILTVLLSVFPMFKLYCVPTPEDDTIFNIKSAKWFYYISLDFVQLVAYNE